MAEPISQRIVPGAPPPAPPSKNQIKKKRKSAKAKGGSEANVSQTQSPAVATVSIPDSTSAALVEKAPAEEDVKEGAVADELVAHSSNGSVVPAPESTGDAPAAGSAALGSPVVEIISKRLKAATKKIVRELLLLLCHCSR